MTESNEMFLARHDIFVREAREACHKAQFFLGMLYKANSEKTTRIIKIYSPFAMHQIKGLIKGVHIPSTWKDKDDELKAAQPAHTKDEKKTRKKIEDAISLCKQWKKMGDYLSDNHNHRFEKVSAFRAKLYKFLKDSRPETRLGTFFLIGFPNFLSYLYKKITFLWAAVLVGFAFTYVEAINGLLRNEGWGVLVPILLVAAPAIANRIYIEWLFHRDPIQVAFWDICGHPLRSICWLAIEPGRLVRRWAPKTPMASRILCTNVVRLSIYSAWWIAWLIIIPKIESTTYPWYLIIGPSTKTVFAFLVMGFLLLSIANALDLWDFTSRLSIRFLAIVIALIGLGLFLGGADHVVIIIYFFLLAAGFFALLFIKRVRKQNWYVDLVWCILFVVAGIFTIYNRATYMDDIWRDTGVVVKDQIPERIKSNQWPLSFEPPESPSTDPPVVVMIASGGGSRAAVFTGLTLQALNSDSEIAEVANHLQAISSVSGGSLANAAYIARKVANTNEANEKSDADAWKKSLEDMVASLEGDFLWATMGGLINPASTRGTAIEKEWQENGVNLKTYRIGDLIKHWLTAKDSQSDIPPFPIPLFNTASLEGHDVVISPLSQSFYVQKKLHTHAADQTIIDASGQSRRANYYLWINDMYNEDITKEREKTPTWVFYRDTIYGLDNFLVKYNPLLAQAVRASANFPFGFPLVNIETDKDIFFSPQIIKIEKNKKEDPQKLNQISLTDGGALSNSGMWSMYHLLMNNWPALENRGVLLIIADAGKMPVFRDLQKKWNSLFGAIQDQGTIGQNLHRRMFDSLQLKYQDRLAIVKLGLIEKKYFNVMTTWALDKESLDRIKESFKATWPETRTDILKKWHALQASQSPTEIELIDRRRPPLD
jgi:predicted acylesterase/phospholipase RssA